MYTINTVPFRPEILRSRTALPSNNAAAAGHAYHRRPPGIRDAVVFPDQVLVFMDDHSPLIPHNGEISCLYYYDQSFQPELVLDHLAADVRFVRCPLPPRLDPGTRVALREDDGPVLVSKRWDSLAYAAIVDAAADNTTVVFVKGLHLRAERLAKPSRFECVYSDDLTLRGRRLVRSPAISAAQEVVRCRTPAGLLEKPALLASMQVSVNVKGKGILATVVSPSILVSDGQRKMMSRVCVCTMLRNQARFMKEWIMYHRRIGVDRWFIYDNNSEDDMEPVIDELLNSGYQIDRYAWPWIKSQEAGFAHCAMRARGQCEWLGFIDVDEFVRLPKYKNLSSLLKRYSDKPKVGELRVSCLNFGPSGLTRSPNEGVTVGYTCRMVMPERHKSFIRPEALSPTLVNIVHHFHLKEGYKAVDMDTKAVVINHYKYQVWEVFKEKFVRRVSTYVADWQDEANAASKDRAPGLGTRPIEPADWPNRFCEVHDTGLRNWVLKEFKDPVSSLLPWQQVHPTVDGV